MAPQRATEELIQDLLMASTIRKTDQRREYVLGHLVLLSLAIGAAVVGAVCLVFPDALEQSALGQALPGGTERIWALLYSISGSMVATGYVRLDARYEVFGCSVIAGCFCSYGYAILAENGLVPGAIVAGLLFSLSVGFGARAYVLRFEPGGRPWSRRQP